MGLSNILPAGGDQSAAPASGAPDAGTTPAKSPDFGQRLGNYFESKYPITGGLAHAVFGGGQPQAAASVTADTPLPQLPGQPAPDYSMLAMNAQPQQGGGLATLLKLFA